MWEINAQTAITVLITAVIFWLFGKAVGFRSGAKTQSEVVIDVLIAEGYVKTRRNDKGEIEIQKLDEES